MSDRRPITSSTNITDADRKDLIVKFSIYVGEGVILIVINFAMVVAIIRRSALRKQYVILLGLFVTYGCAGCGTLSAGIGRLIVLQNNAENEDVGRRDCMLKIWNILFIWTDPMCAIMLLVVSIDRLLAISMPIRYFKASGRLGYLEVIISHVFMICSAIIGWTSTLLFSETNKTYSKICWSSDSINSGYYIYHTWLRIVSALLSVLLYFVVLVLMRIHAKKVAPTQNISQENLTLFSKRQLQLTVSMGISCLFTCLFYISPICVELYAAIANSNEEILGYILTYSQIIGNFSSICNAIVLFHRHVDIRRSLMSCISCGRIASTNATAVNEAPRKNAIATARNVNHNRAIAVYHKANE